MDANRILLLWTLFGCAVLFARNVRGRPGQRGWLAVAGLMLLVSGVAHLALPAYAGYLGFAVWMLLVMAPSLGSRELQRLLGRQQYRQGRRLATLLAFLHPLDGWRGMPSILAALELAQRGDAAAAGEILQRLQAEGHPATAAQASSHLFHLRGDWQGLREWIEREVRLDALGGDPVMLIQYLRCLGETGDLDRMLEVLQRHSHMLERTQLITVRRVAYLYAFAFGGRTAATARALDMLPMSMSAGTRVFWLATAEGAAGDDAGARARLEALVRHDDAMMRSSAQFRVARPPALAADALSVASKEILLGLEQGLLHEERYAERTGRAGSRPLLTRALVALNLAMFAVEILAGGSEDYRALYELGAVFTPGFATADAWRLLASTFLHFGPLHLTMNMLGLLVMGPYLERALGAARYLGVYLCAGIFGALAVVVVQSAASEEGLMVGASGSIMGLIGGTGAVLLRGWRSEGARPALRRLRGVVVILSLQVIFDVTTPQISFTAHLAGAVTGFLACALMKHWQPSGPAPERA